MENKCTKGLILSGLILAAAALVFAMSKDGRCLTKKLKEDFRQMTKHLKENFGKLRDATKDDFDELVNTLVDEYAKKKELGNDSKEKIAKILKSKWDEIKEEYASDTKSDK